MLRILIYLFIIVFKFAAIYIFLRSWLELLKNLWEFKFFFKVICNCLFLPRIKVINKKIFESKFSRNLYCFPWIEIASRTKLQYKTKQQQQPKKHPTFCLIEFIQQNNNCRRSTYRFNNFDTWLTIKLKKLP